MKKFQNKYRTSSIRAQWWDYGWNGAYFITLCTHKRQHFFGEIHNKIMHLTPLGIIADILWHEIPHHASGVDLGEFVVMPSHIHGILILNKPNTDDNDKRGDGRGDGLNTGHALYPPSPSPPSPPSQPPSSTPNPSTPTTIGQQRFQNIGKKSVSSLIGSYKSAVTKHANRLGLKNGWQTRFYDHIIRNEAAYQRIAQYIINNPTSRKEDKFYSL